MIDVLMYFIRKKNHFSRNSICQGIYLYKPPPTPRDDRKQLIMTKIRRLIKKKTLIIKSKCWGQYWWNPTAKHSKPGMWEVVSSNPTPDMMW